MAKTLHSKRYNAFIALLIKEREATGLSQTELARALGRYQSFISRIETGQRRVDVIEFIDIATALEFDPKEFLKKFEKR